MEGVVFDLRTPIISDNETGLVAGPIAIFGLARLPELSRDSGMVSPEKEVVPISAEYAKFGENE